jgi:hypothetical protein
MSYLKPLLGLRPVVWTSVRAASLWQRRIEPRLGPLFARLRRLGLVSSPNHFVLTIGDEGATLVQMRGREVIDAVLIGPESEDGLGTLRGYLDADPAARLTVAVDVLEQMYRDEQLPKVNRFDRGTILRRRLELSFPHDRLKAALPLAGGKALFAALPETEHVAQWVEFLESLANPVTGFCLMPLEGVDIAAELGPSTAGETRQIWRVLASHQATSGFRQIFETGGRLMVTRLTARPSAEMTPEATAQLIERELRSSISYLKRLGYAEQDRLDLVVLESPEVCRAVQERDLPVASLTAYTPHQAGLLLGLGIVAPEESGFSDVLLAQWLATKRHPTVTLPSPVLKEKRDLDAVFRVGFGLAACLSLFTLYELGSLTLDAFETTSTTEVLAGQMKTEEQAAVSIRTHLAGLDVKVEDVALVANLADEIAAGGVDLGAVLDTVSASLDPGMIVQSLSYHDGRLPAFVQPGDKAPVRPPPPRGGTPAIELTISVRLPAEMAQPEEQLLAAKALRERLLAALPGYEVDISHLPVDTLHPRVLSGSAGQAVAQAARPTADYILRKKG